MTNFFGLVNFGTLLSPEALCPLAEPLPPDSVSAARVDEAEVTTELTAHLLEGEGGLETRKIIKKPTQNSRKATTSTHRSLLPVEVAPRFRVLADSTDGSYAAPFRTPDAVRLTDGPVHKNNHH